MYIGFEALRKIFMFYLNPLKNLEFTFLNPLFWAFLFLLFIMLCRIWEAKKSIHFCLLLAFILLCTTEIESRVVALFSAPDQSIDTTLIKFISIFLVTLLFIFYVFLL